MKFTPIEFDITAANCPFCGAYSSFTWGRLLFSEKKSYSRETDYYAGICLRCDSYTIWKDIRNENYTVIDQIQIYPLNNSVPIPNDDLPADVRADYIEASEIVGLSPRGAAALLRLALQKLCKHLGGIGKNINEDIKDFVDRGLNPIIQKALDSVRVIGNQAVHPGYLDLNDDRETAIKLFNAINFIAEAMITQPKMISELYDFGVSDDLKEAISKRDQKN